MKGPGQRGWKKTICTNGQWPKSLSGFYSVCLGVAVSYLTSVYMVSKLWGTRTLSRVVLLEMVEWDWKPFVSGPHFQVCRAYVCGVSCLLTLHCNEPACWQA